MVNQSIPVALRTRGKRDARILEEYRKLKRKEKENKDQIKTNAGLPAECHDVICVDDDISTECSEDDPVTSTSGEVDGNDSDDLDYGEEDEESEEKEEEDEEDEVELVSENSVVGSSQVYNSQGKPVGWKRKRKHELNDGLVDDDEDTIDLTASKTKREGSKPEVNPKASSSKKVDHRKPVGRKRQRKYELNDGSIDDDPDDDDTIEFAASKHKQSGRKPEVNPPRASSSEKVDLIKVLTDSILDKEDTDSTLVEALREDRNCLPQRLTFGINGKMSPKQAEADYDDDQEEKLWAEMQFCMAYAELGSTHPSMAENEDADTSEDKQDTASLCRQGKHRIILDEEIGMICQYCSFVQLEMKYIVPPFMTDSLRNSETLGSRSGGPSIFDGFQYEDSNSDKPGCDPSANIQGTVWEIIPNVRSQLFPHQREGFEFIWNNVAGGIYRDPEKNTYSGGGGGCIVSHAPGTGKTLLTIVFLYTYLKVNPDSRPVIVAPRSMLLTWEAEFRKWNFDVIFHNLNNPDFSGKEMLKAVGLYEKFKKSASDTALARRLVKLLSWKSDGGILGISYRLFEQLAGTEAKGRTKCGHVDECIRKSLLNLPGLFVFDEGHTPRNDETLMWKALSNIKTDRRIILSGTPFQNNFDELFNTLCLVRPKFAERVQSGHRSRVNKIRGCKTTEAKKTWASMTGSIGKVHDAYEAEKLEGLRAMIKPFVHVHKGSILQSSLPGLRHSVVVLHPSSLQKKILDYLKQTKNALCLDYYVSMISVHPSLMKQLPDLRDKERISSLVSADKLERIRLQPDQGVKTKFVKELLKLSEALDEKVIVFSQYLEPLNLIMEQLIDFFKWKEGKEILYMHGGCDVKQRQASISVFNDPTSKARVLLASTKACSEGINLVGGSRVVLLDVTWNPSVERQAISRAYRLGQKKVVYTYHLISSGTLEGLKCRRQAGKDRLSNLVFSPSDNDSHDKNKVYKASEDKLLEAMVQHEKLKSMFDNIINEPKDSDLITTFGDF